jgi:hypothetical protein
MTYSTIPTIAEKINPTICLGGKDMLKKERPAMLRQQHAGLTINRLVRRRSDGC